MDLSLNARELEIQQRSRRLCDEHLLPLEILCDENDGLTPEQLAEFRARGVITVRGLVRPEELAQAAAVFERLMSGELAVEGKDHGQHTPGLMNVTAFSLYHDIAALGVFAAIEARAAAVTAARRGDGHGV